VVDDGSDVGLDLSRGYFDAGDYILATYPLAFVGGLALRAEDRTLTTHPSPQVLFSISWGALSHGSGYDSAKQTPYLDEMLRWGLDWSMRVRPASLGLGVPGKPLTPAPHTGTSAKGRLVCTSR
jgi:endoglucanase